MKARTARRAGSGLWLALWLWTLPHATRAEAPPEPTTTVDAGSTQPAAESDPGTPAEEASALEGPLKVAVAGSPPFVERDSDGELSGLSVEMWRALNGEASAFAQAELLPFDNVDLALEAVREGRADAALGPISITAERAQKLSFSQPYFLSSLSILAPATESLWTRLAPFATRAFGAGVLLLFLVLGGVGTLLWLCERRVNPEQFPAHPLYGVGSGIWLALVTMTTVGYGDLAPVTRRGRVVAGVWMVIAMLTASSLTASIATALTLSQLETPGISSASDLEGKPIAVIDPSPAADFVRDAGGRVMHVDDVRAGIAAVRSDEAQAMVWDRPVLSYYLKRHPESELSLSSTSYHPRGYGIAARHTDAALLRAIDLGILRLQEDGELDRLENRWLPK